MSFPSGEEPADFQHYHVGKHKLTAYGSFEHAVADPGTGARKTLARREWAATDPFTVKSYSYSLDRLLINFGSLTLEVWATSPVVEWKLSGLPPTLFAGCPNPCVIIERAYNDAEVFFDRDAVLSHILGKRVRHSPSTNAVYLLLPPHSEIPIVSMPLTETEGFVLFYSGPHTYTSPVRSGRENG
ncbi:MAG TPA: hypothetical protein VGE52_01550 [Pirellulales bacterium]